MDCRENTGKQMVGYAWVPIQKMDQLYPPQTAIAEGTIFPELNIPIGQYERGLYNGK